MFIKLEDIFNKINQIYLYFYFGFLKTKLLIKFFKYYHIVSFMDLFGDQNSRKRLLWAQKIYYCQLA